MAFSSAPALRFLSLAAARRHSATFLIVCRTSLGSNIWSRIPTLSASSMKRAIASRTRRLASSRVRPCVWQPWSLATVATHHPPSSRSYRTVKRLIVSTTSSRGTAQGHARYFAAAQGRVPRLCESESSSSTSRIALGRGSLAAERPHSQAFAAFVRGRSPSPGDYTPRNQNLSTTIDTTALARRGALVAERNSYPFLALSSKLVLRLRDFSPSLPHELQRGQLCRHLPNSLSTRRGGHGLPTPGQEETFFAPLLKFARFEGS